jgi:putative nucleotidyltransferase with HDIG domain
MINLPREAQTIIDVLAAAGFEAYAVGGSVRDTLMGKPTHGWDFATSAPPEQILELFPQVSFYDNQFGTVGIKILNKKKETEDVYEVTTFRSEKGYKDHRHPDKVVWGKTIAEDLSRRDFTINAIATDGRTIVDPFKGQDDIKNKLIRAVGEPEKRFAEDSLRLMRAVRIASQLGFGIEKATLEAIKKNATLLSSISQERIRDELIRILASPQPDAGIMLLRDTGLLAIILPELTEAFDVAQKSPKRHHIYDVGLHSVMALKHCPSADPIVRFATLIHDIGKTKTVKVLPDGVITFYNHEVAGTRMAREIVARLRLSRKDAEKVLTLVRWHQFTVDERQTDSAIRRFIRRVGKENIEDMLALRIGDRLGGGARETSWRLELYKKRLEEVQKQPFTVSDLKVSGHDVMKEYEVAPGPVVGAALNALFAEVEAGTVANKRKDLLARLAEKKDALLSPTS